MINPRDVGIYRKENNCCPGDGHIQGGRAWTLSHFTASSFSSHLREDPEVREEAGLVEVTEKFRRPDEEHANSHTLFKKYVGYLPGI